MRQILIPALFLGIPVLAMGHCGALFSAPLSNLPPSPFHKHPVAVGWDKTGPNGVRFDDPVNGIIKPKESGFGAWLSRAGRRLARKVPTPTSGIYITPDGKHALFIDRYLETAREPRDDRKGAEIREVLVYQLHENTPPELVSRSREHDPPSLHRQLVYLSNNYYVVLDRQNKIDPYFQLTVYSIDGSKRPITETALFGFRDIAFDAQERRVAFISESHLHFYDLQTGNEISGGLGRLWRRILGTRVHRHIEEGEEPQSLAFSPDGALLAVGTVLRPSRRRFAGERAQTLLIDIEAAEIRSRHRGLLLEVDRGGWTEKASRVSEIRFGVDGKMHVVFPRNTRHQVVHLGETLETRGPPEIQVIGYSAE